MATSHSAREAGRIAALQELGLAEGEKVAFPTGAAFNALAGAGKWGGKQLWRLGSYAIGGGPINPAVQWATRQTGRGINAALRGMRVPEGVRNTLPRMPFRVFTRPGSNPFIAC